MSSENSLIRSNQSIFINNRNVFNNYNKQTID